ncbi:hypothetical protein PF004_g30954 [Phytophthora fragariae]|uniref:Uncharacterized protein n=1 Tax=Phytophthora fragariae TaxID=53985 RepID=A0A6A3GK95_9STRA|nr:hypothetical protein PF011_g31008 [Phytophthora fragariae]KAE9161091.1 hypothetical protein PF004_g30954 [Phytophthora fragariae]KAE9267014.1 hypothetical protein PF008_g31455 [Phytophthora fragariae]
MTDEVEQEKQEKQNVIDHEHTRETHETELAQLNEKEAGLASATQETPRLYWARSVSWRATRALWGDVAIALKTIHLDMLCVVDRQFAEIVIVEVNRRMPWLYPLLMDLVRVSNAEVRAALASVFSKVVGLRFRVVLVAMSDVLGGNGSQ